MRVRKIDPDWKRDVEQFVHFPFELYRDCPQWVPLPLSSAKFELNRHRHPYYRHSSADFFVAEGDGQTTGRISVMHNRRYNRYRRIRAAFFGHFEAVEDPEVARRLFKTAFSWAYARGLYEMIGPRGLTGIEGGSVLVEGFDYPAAMAIPYNLAYYDALIRDSGFGKDTDYLSGYLNGGTEASARIRRIADKVKRRRGFTIKTFRSRRELRRWVPRLLDVHRQAFSQNHTYVPPTEAETAMMVATLLRIADPRLVKVVLQEEEIVGFVFVYQDLARGLQRAQGRIWPFGWFHLLRERYRTKRFNGNGIGLLPAYRGLGANAVLYAEVSRTMNAVGYEHLELVQVEEGNHKSLADMEALGVHWYKRHRSYRRML